MHSVSPKENNVADNLSPAASHGLRVQTKLSIGAVNDPLEHEADAMADRVMSMQVPSAISTGSTGIRRKCAECEEEERLQRKPLASFIQRKESASGAVASDIISNQINASRGNGSTMDGSTQSFMQSRFGTNFSDVKIHTGGKAIQMNRELNAKAFTVGNDIYFNEGQYKPNSDIGKHLLAHELTHTVQQGGNVTSLQKSSLTDDEINMGDEMNEGTYESEIDEPADMIAQLKTKAPSAKKKPKPKASPCPWQKQSKVVRNDCSPSGPANRSNFIKSLDVDLSSQYLTVTWKDGTIKKWLCSPHPSNTPKGKDVVGDKCSVDHTNLKKDGMAWFTSFKSKGLRIGFHNSQMVASGTFSHGCVRVSCDHAKIINQNSWSGITKINVVK